MNKLVYIRNNKPQVKNTCSPNNRQKAWNMYAYRKGRKLAASLSRSFLFITLTLVLLSATSCTKEEPKHRDIVTATINGKPWKAGCKESPPFGCTIADLQYYTDTGGFSLRAGNVELDTSIAIRLWEVHNSGFYKIPSNIQCATVDKKSPCGWQGHYIDENDPQEIEIISIDNEKKIIEGRFHYIGRDTVCGSEPVHITNGYFKVKYRP